MSNTKDLTAFLFSGQGSQYKGMGQELLSEFPKLSSIYDEGSEILGFDLKKICFDTEEDILAQTQYSQPAIFATSLLAYEVALLNGFKPDMVGGHSLGEYAALVASGVLSRGDGFKVIKERAYAMGECAKNQDGAMYAIIGLDASEISRVCEETEGYVLPVNFNSPSQTVIAGEATAAEAVAQKFIDMGKRAMKLSVSAAFHSKLMQPAADSFKSAIKDIKFNCPTIPFYSNLNGEPIEELSNMPEYLARHLVSSVKFTDELFNMQKAGANSFIECGPNKVLTGLVKKTLSDVQAFNLENKKTLDKLVESK